MTETISDRLRYAREQAGLSQGQAARLLHCFPQKLICLELGKQQLTVHELKEFAELYHVSAAWLLGERTEADLDPRWVERLAKLPESDRQKLTKLLTAIGE